MSINIGREVAAMRRMTVKQLRERYAELFGDLTRTGNKAWLIKRICWRLQELDEGGLTERARRRAHELANEADLRMSPPRARKIDSITTANVTTSSLRLSADGRLPLPGTILTREYKGDQLQVRVLERGFEFEGEVYRSLSALAKEITGSHVNGFQFFRLRKGGHP